MDGMTGGVIGGVTALAFAAGALGAGTTPVADGDAEALGFALDAIAGWPGTGGVGDATGASSGAIDTAGGAEADADVAAVGRAEACASGALSPFLNNLHPLRVSESSTVDATMPFTIDWGTAKRRSMRHSTPMSSDSSKRKWH